LSFSCRGGLAARNSGTIAGLEEVSESAQANVAGSTGDEDAWFGHGDWKMGYWASDEDAIAGGVVTVPGVFVIDNAVFQRCS
jgi:hypothetical protein